MLDLLIQLQVLVPLIQNQPKTKQPSYRREGPEQEPPVTGQNVRTKRFLGRVWPRSSGSFTKESINMLIYPDILCHNIVWIFKSKASIFIF